MNMNMKRVPRGNRDDTVADELEPDWSRHPGEFLADVLEARGLRQSELAERTGLSAKHVNQLVGKSVGISSDIAVLLERALNVSAATWMHAQSDWEIHGSRKRTATDLSKLTNWVNRFDQKTLIREGIIDSIDDVRKRIDKVLTFFEVSNLAGFEKTWTRPRVSFRRQQNFEISEANTALWLRLVERAATDTHAVAFKPAVLRKAVAELPRLTTYSVPDGFLGAQALLRDAGVSLVFVRCVPNSRIYGATWWLDARRPIIGVTERYKKPDTFWFTILHECAHLLRHPKRQTFLDKDTEIDPDAEGLEREANEFARDALIGKALARIASTSTPADLVRLAQELEVGVSIVAGQRARATGEWGGLTGKLRGRIDDADVAALERLTVQLKEI